MTGGFEEVRDGNELVAIVVYSSFSQPGVQFFTPDNLSQQMAFMKHPAGKKIDAHVHNPVPRQVSYTQEALFIRSGSLRVDFYTEDQDYMESRVLRSGDVVLLVSGGHGFEVLEDLEMIEVKQGPHVGAGDKTRFDSIALSKIRFPEHG